MKACKNLIYMLSRRRFLRSAAIGSLMLKSTHLFASGYLRNRRKLNAPLVVSTWDFGQAANRGAWEVLGKGGKSIDAVECGVKIPEADPENQTIGYGGRPDRDGYVTLDACIMDENYNCGAVMCLPEILHPISVARLVMERTPHIALSGEGALQFALANGFERTDLLTDKSRKEWKQWLKTSNYHPEKNIENKVYNKADDPMPGGVENHDTIGLMAMDIKGDLSGACTTSGLAYKMHGRVGDSPIIGAGLYVDNEVGAATSSGVGEEVMRIVGSHLIVELMRTGVKPELACKKAVERIIKINPEKARNIQVGFVAINIAGEYGAYSLQPGFTYAVKNNVLDKVFKANSYYK